jgi:hypothetical protein
MLGLLAVAAAAPAYAQSAPTAAPREVNLTSDSAPGWLPTEEDERLATKAATDYLDAFGAGRAADAHLMLAEPMQRDLSLKDLEKSSREFRALSGPLTARRLIKVTWTKDPQAAPAPGIYAAIDFVSRFQSIDRHCGYVVVYRPPAGGAFKVMRDQSSYMDNRTAAAIAAKGSQADVDLAWREASAGCPNYPDRPPLPESSDDSVGYPSVAAALTALRAGGVAKFSTADGWTIATDEASRTIWSFSPPGHPAHPAVVKRQIVTRGGGSSIEMSVLCEASKVACDELVDIFNRMNAQAAGR